MRRGTRVRIAAAAVGTKGRRLAAVLSVVVFAGMTMAPVTGTAASWQDSEYVSGRAGGSGVVGTVDCQDATGAFDTRAAGRALSGSVFGVDLDSLAEASGVVVTNDGTRAAVSPEGANPAPADPAYADPLNVTALTSVNADLGSGMLQLPLDNSTGLLGQYASAASTGDVAGASGYLTSTGGIATEPGSGYPELATLALSDLLGSLNYDLGELLPSITDAGLEIGAVTGRATLDGCAAAWGADLADALARQYLVSSLDLVSTTPTVGALTTGARGAVTTLESTVHGLTTGNTAVLDSLTGAVTGLLNGLVSGVLHLGSVTVTGLQATVDTAALTAFLDKPFGDDEGVLTIDPTSGEVRIDTAALLQQAYPGQYGDGLNGLPPNTDPLADPHVATALTGALSAALDDWVDEINGLLDAAIDAVTVHTTVTTALKVDALVGMVSIGTVTATVDGSLGDLLAGTVPATVTTDLDLGLVGALLTPTVNALVATLTAGLVADLGRTVGTTLNSVLGPLRTLPTTVTDTVAPIITAISGLYTNLFVNGIVNITINAQNDPAASPTPGPVPSDWGAGSTEIPHGQFDVAALRIGVLDDGGTGGTNDVHLYLGRGSVGPVRSVANSGG